MALVLTIIGLKGKQAGAKLNPVAMPKGPGGGDGNVIDKAAVGAAEIGDPVKPTIPTDGRMLSGNTIVLKTDAGIRAAAQDVEVRQRVLHSLVMLS